MDICSDAFGAGDFIDADCEKFVVDFLYRLEHIDSPARIEVVFIVYCLCKYRSMDIC